MIYNIPNRKRGFPAKKAAQFLYGKDIAMARIITHPPVRSGMPLGGIGAGSVELRPDGEFHEWQIANPQQFSMDCRDLDHPDKGEGLAGSLSFYLLAQSGGKPILRRLGMGFGPDGAPGGEKYRQRMYSFHKLVEEIEYEAAFPTARLAYRDSALPLNVRLEAASPFVPFSARDAGTPGFYLTFTLENTSSAPIEVSLAAKLMNILPESGRENDLDISDDRAVLTMRTPNPRQGSVALSMSGGRLSGIPGDYSGFMSEYVSDGDLGVVEESFLFSLMRLGQLPTKSSAAFTRPKWPDAAKAIAMTDGEVDALLEKAKQYAFAESILDRNLTVLPELGQTPEGRRRLLSHLLENVDRLTGKGSWGDGALCSHFTLQPGEEKRVEMEFAWYFPNLISGGGANVGHVYENWFHNAREAADELREKREKTLSAVRLFSQNVYDSSFPECFADAVTQQLANLIKSAWWTRDGSFGVWEGLGSCGFHTMDITYHGSFGLIALFPELQKAQMEMGAKFQREDGRIPHFFTPDFSRVDNGFERVDMNPQFVLLVCRDYFATGDRAYLERMWPHVIRAIDSIAALDTDGDCLPDKDTAHNTYDAWNFSGTSTYISVLWLAALKAACAMAEAMGDGERLSAWRAWIQKGSATVEEKLFNGDYYNLWISGSQLDTCCMTDQLDGEYFARLTGLGGLLPDAHVASALDSIYRLNYSRENGLINASYPENGQPTLYTYRNCQGTANWSGVEFMMAAFYLLMGRYEQGLSVTANVQERHVRMGEMFNHEECGDHYYRPLSSWALLQALSGVSVNQAQRTLRVEPAPLSVGQHAPWFAFGAFGQVRRLDHAIELHCLCGRLETDFLQTPSGKTPHPIRLAPGDSVRIDLPLD